MELFLLLEEEIDGKCEFRKSNGFVGQAESPKYSKRYNVQHLNKFALIFNCSPKDFLPDIAFELNVSTGEVSRIG
ncbi:hypothetical protein ACTJIK_13520 [Chitinophaga sp. 22620]